MSDRPPTIDPLGSAVVGQHVLLPSLAAGVLLRAVANWRRVAPPGMRPEHLASLADRVANQIDAGMVLVNGVLLDGAELPFGGVKRSGFGRELGPYGMDEFVNKKLIRVVK